MSINRSGRQITYQAAIAEALMQIMQHRPEVFVMGLGVSDYKGIFGTTTAISKRFGGKRVIETPASENALSGIAIGAALFSKRPIIVHARNDFMFLTLDQIINNGSKWSYTYNGSTNVPFVVRGIIGKGWGQGPSHSQSIQSVFLHFPGLYLMMPSTPYDAKGLLAAAVEERTPCIILEHRALYDTVGLVPERLYKTPFGKARTVCRGKDITLVATSLMVQEAVKAHHALAKMGISVEVIDPRSLRPLDEEAILRSVKKTGRLMVADTSWTTAGFSSEVAALVAEKALSHLRSPVKRIGLANSPAPASKCLEDEFYPSYKTIFLEACNMLNRKADYKMIEDPIIDHFKGPY